MLDSHCSLADHQYHYIAPHQDMYLRSSGLQQHKLLLGAKLQGFLVTFCWRY
jgi:hypothetical protein